MSALGYAPGIVLMMMSNQEQARTVAQVSIDPMIEMCPALRERVAPPRSRDRENNQLNKSFPVYA